MSKTRLFFELIQLAIGSRDGLSFVPTSDDWTVAYDLADKQALIGVCFCGVQKAYDHDACKMVNLSSKLKMRWLSVATNIQKRNKLMNVRCAELYERLNSDVYNSCVLKGQAVARLYDDGGKSNDKYLALRLMRQSGDIDMWMVADTNTVIEWAKSTQTMFYYDYHHADLSLFPDAEIELHYRPSISRNLWRNNRLQRWFKTEGSKHIVHDDRLGFNVPDDIFSLLLTLNHNLWHLLYEGVGLRQMMDLYFVAKAMRSSDESKRLLSHFKLCRFASASAWVLWYLFDGCRADSLFVKDSSPLPSPNEKAGRFLLSEIMKSGNFGHYDSRNNWSKSGSRVLLMIRWIRHTFRLFMYYPIEVLWTPLGILWISFWRRCRYMKYKPE